MSDGRLRELERRWAETGSSEDEAELLRERVRVGALTLARLELAALLGHPAAGLASGLDPMELTRLPGGPWSELEESEDVAWLLVLRERGGEAALLRVLAAVLVRNMGAEDPASPHGRLAAQVDAFALAPEDDERRLALREHRGSDWGLTRNLARWLEEWGEPPLSRTLRTCVVLRVSSALVPQGWSGAVAAIRAELVPWLLGRGDPVQARVAQRAPVDE